MNLSNSENLLFNALTQSLKKGTIVGIYADALGEGMFVTAVEDIYNAHNEQIIVFKTRRFKRGNPATQYFIIRRDQGYLHFRYAI